MNEHLKNFIGKYVTVTFKFVSEGSPREEYIQGIFKDVEDDVVIIEQHMPFSNLFIKDASTQKLERKINVSNMRDTKFF